MEKDVITEDYCSRCGKYVIFNKTHRLCFYCNFERNHKGVSYKEYQLGKINLRYEKAKRRAEVVRNMKKEVLKKGILSTDEKYCSVKGCVEKAYTYKYGNLCTTHYFKKRKNDKLLEENKKRKLKVRSQAVRERKIKRELSKIKKEAKEISSKSGGVCEGCGVGFSNILDYSHILSVAQRKDLELDKDNKNMLCRTCHNKWESNNAEKLSELKCLYRNLEYIRKKDEGRFWQIYFIFNDAMMMEVCKKIEEMDENFKNESNNRRA